MHQLHEMRKAIAEYSSKRVQKVRFFKITQNKIYIESHVFLILPFGDLIKVKWTR